MLSLSNMKDGAIVPSEEDRKKIVNQMKVKTTLRGDNSWIQKKSDSEEEKNHSPLDSPLRIRKTRERSPMSPKVSPLNHRAVFEELSSQAEQQSPGANKPSKKAVFEELSSQAEQQAPVANKPSKKSHSTTSPSGYLIRGVFTKTVDKNASSNTVSNGFQKSAKTASSAPGYKMSTEDYKKLAPYNVKRDTAPDHIDVPVSPDEQQKRTEAASSVLRQTARKERSYVLSAAKKSNGVEIEDDTGPRSRSQTMPASSWVNSRGKSTTAERRSMWSDQRISNASSSTSIDTGSKNHAFRHSTGYSSAFNHFTSLENSNKQDQEKHNQTSWNGSLPKGSVSSPTISEKNEGKFQPTSGSETQDAILSEDSWEERKPQSAEVNENFQVSAISPESSPKSRFSFHYQTADADTAEETHHQLKTEEYLNENDADSARYVADQEEGTFSKEIKYESPSSISTEEQPATENLEKKTTQEEEYEIPNETEYKKAEAHLAKSDSCSSEGSLSTAATQTEFPEAAKSEEPQQETASSSSVPTDSSVAAPESKQAERGSDADASSFTRRATFSSSGSNYRMPTNLDHHLVCNHGVLESGPRTSPYLNRQASYPSRTSCGMPSCPSCQSYNPNMSEMNHTMTSYLNNPGFSSGRSYSTSRDSLITNSMRSHRVPFYKDICDAETRRYLPRAEERAAFTSSFPTTSSQPRYPAASGYDSDPTTASKALLLVKESINSTELSSSPRYNSRSLVDLSTLERSNYNGGNYLQSTPARRLSEDICTYCGREIRNCPKIKIEKLNICCHDFCFRCGICHKPMGDLLDKIFIHRDIVHCDKCYEKLF